MAKHQENPVEPVKNKFRYYCHGCTKTAAVSPTPYTGSIIVCPHCGKEQTATSENWLPL